MTGRLLCFGFGYSASVLAHRLLARGWNVVGTSREPARRSFPGIDVLRFDRQSPLPASVFEGVTHILTSIAPDEMGDPVLDLHVEDLAHAGLAWAGYLGTTGVYGNYDGAWVDETSELRATSPRARRRIAAEKAWLASGLPAHVFRLAGIYGPGRSALNNIWRGNARRIVKPDQVFSRIHVQDIANVLEASLKRPQAGAIYSVCDDEPAPPQDVVAYAAELLGVAPPPEQPFDSADLSPMARSFYEDNRRVRNDRIKRELGVALRYPTYREGLMAIHQSEEGMS